MRWLLLLLFCLPARAAWEARLETDPPLSWRADRSKIFRKLGERPASEVALPPTRAHDLAERVIEASLRPGKSGDCAIVLTVKSDFAERGFCRAEIERSAVLTTLVAALRRPR